MAEEVVTEVATELAETVVLTLYDKIGATMSGVFLVVFGALMIFRMGKAFHQYIYTGGFDRFIKSSAFATLIDEHPEDMFKAFFTGTNPFGILIDSILPCALLVLVMPIAWGGVVPIMLVMLLAYAMRLRIAKKQDFVSKLDGTHSDLRDNGSENMVQSATSSMRGH